MMTTHDDAVGMTVADVRRARPSDDPAHHHAVVLAEVDGQRRLPIWIGEAEATAIALHLHHGLHGVQPARPQTYQLLLAALEALSASVQEVLIGEVRDNTFYAEVTLGSDLGAHHLDARPSDAINLALRADRPIRVSRSVLDAHADSLGRRLEDADYPDTAVEIAEDFLAACQPEWLKPTSQPT